MKKSVLMLALAGLLVAPTAVLAGEVGSYVDGSLIVEKDLTSDEDQERNRTEEHDPVFIVDNEGGKTDNRGAAPVGPDGKPLPRVNIDVPFGEPTPFSPAEETPAPEVKEETKASEDKKAEGAKEVKAAATKTGSKALPKTSAAK
ncbi:hypothetical protein [Streptococcus moroccensis]|uniref:Uncharacterized protein n=1 Tax=Streptococcus moroccensis TaxID=1451356 RepID=A0ABT9YTB6_9STRE|nr:hypothetical protein [Streptococcus moroccensis]MDQ0222862.1 hypothetical protein [Streptococcus moroccensis]